MISTYGQGQVNFANTASTLLTTNSCCGGVGVTACRQTGVTTGAGQYTIGLYVAPFGAVLTTGDDHNFSLVATTPSQGLAGNGRFNGGNVTVLGLVPGTLVAFQIRAWQTAAGSTYEQAQQNVTAIASGRFYLGKSARGFAIVGGSGISDPPIPSLMGTNYGQVPGFAIYYGGGPYYGPAPQYQIGGEFSCGFPPAMTNVPLRIISSPSGTHTISWNNNSSASPGAFLLQWAPTLPASNQ